MSSDARCRGTIEEALRADDPVEELVATSLELDSGDRALLLEELARVGHELHARVTGRLADLDELGLTGPDLSFLPDRLGDFRLGERVGAGGMGVVYVAEQISLGRKVALKVVRPGQLFVPGTRERFQREVRTIASLQHPGIVPVHAVGEEQGVPYYAMQWIDGVSLHAVLARLAGRDPRELGRADLVEALRSSTRGDVRVDPEALERALPGKSWTEMCLSIATRIARALHHAHERGVVHRDVKPSNVMVSVDGAVQLLDFGLASSPGTSRLTLSGALVGTLPYMSPEQVADSAAAPHRLWDVYALGVTVYELLTLRSPFLHEDVHRTRSRILAGMAPSIRGQNGQVNVDVETVCLQAMDKSPERRYATAAAFADDLLRARDRLPVAARRPPVPVRVGRWATRHRGQAASLALLCATALGTTAFGVREQGLRHRMEQLADVHRYRYLIERAEGFWPVDAGRIDDMRAWIADAEELLARRELHLASLADLRSGAGPYGPEDAQDDARAAVDALVQLDGEVRALVAFRDRSAHGSPGTAEASRGPERPLGPSDGLRLADELAATIDAFEATLDPGEIDELSQVEAFRRELAPLRREVTARRTWTFPGSVERWRHELLVELVGGLDEIEGRLSAVRLQLEHAQILERSYRARWASPLRAIEASPVYGGLRIEPQLDLLPLGPDPRTGLWEFLLQFSGEPPPARPDGAGYAIAEESGLVVVLLPGGVAVLGDPLPSRGGIDAPRHTVELDPFFVSKYEVTRAQARRLGVAPARAPSVDGLLPLEATWFDHRAALLPWGLDLPTEAQWEYACRGGTSSTYFTGEDLASLAGHANVLDPSWGRAYGHRADVPVAPFDDGHGELAPVGSYLPNPFGLHDIVGNAAEFCRDEFVHRGYRTLPPRAGDGLRDTFNETDLRPVRGGSWNSLLSQAASSVRFCSVTTASCAARPVRPVAGDWSR